MSVFLKLAIDVFGKLLILLRVGGVVVIKADMETGEIDLMLLADTVDQLFRGNTPPFSAEHDGSAVGVVGANVIAVMATHVLVAYPDNGLNVLQQVPQMNGPVAVGQGAGNRSYALLLARFRHGVVRTFCCKGCKTKTGLSQQSQLIVAGKDPIWSETGTDDTFRAIIFHLHSSL